MGYLHDCGLIHRDLKSLNILVSKLFEVKICDFGLSRVVDKNTAMTSNIGTVAWYLPISSVDLLALFSCFHILAASCPFTFSLALVLFSFAVSLISKDCP